MIKLLGNLVFLVLIIGVMAFDPVTSGAAQNPRTVSTLTQRIGLYGILSLAAGTLIITGGIDLSMGSLVALMSTVLWKLLIDWQWDPMVSIVAVLAIGAAIGLFHGLMIAVVGVQAFIVTLCGLFIYRSIAQSLSSNNTVGFANDYTELRAFFNGSWLSVPMHFWILIVLCILLGVFLHFSVYGRYFFAIGNNEKAAAYSGVRTTRFKILAYVLCSLLTTVFAILNMFWMNSVQPSTTGNFFELYGIAGAVLGGCSLRGGDGNVLGIVLGTCIIWLLPTYANFRGIPSELNNALFGTALLFGAFIDEMLRRYHASRGS